MLRESKADLAGTPPGTVVLSRGHTRRGEAETMSRFIASYATTDGIAKPAAAIRVPDPWRKYLPETLPI